jgi:hypothetical protein
MASEAQSRTSAAEDLVFDFPTYEEFIEVHNGAVRLKADSFVFRDVLFLTSFSRRVIEYLSEYFGDTREETLRVINAK